MTMPFSQLPIDPPDPPLECRWCEGQTKVALHAILDIAGQVQLVWNVAHFPDIEVDCPRCSGTGSEPPGDPSDDPRIP